jgi:hypothetical protein
MKRLKISVEWKEKIKKNNNFDFCLFLFISRFFIFEI